MNTRLVAVTLALTLMLGLAAALKAPGTTEEISKQSFTEADAPREATKNIAMTADLGLVADVIAEARREVRLGADPSESLERLTSTKAVGFNQLGTAWLTPEDVEECKVGKVVWKISLWGGIVDGCDRASMWTDPLGIDIVNVQGWLFAGAPCFVCNSGPSLPDGVQTHGFLHANGEAMGQLFIGSLFGLGAMPMGLVVGEFSGTSVQQAGAIDVTMSGQRVASILGPGGDPLNYQFGGNYDWPGTWYECGACTGPGSGLAFASGGGTTGMEALVPGVAVGAFWDNPILLEGDEPIPVLGAWGGPDVSLVPAQVEESFPWFPSSEKR